MCFLSEQSFSLSERGSCTDIKWKPWLNGWLEFVNLHLLLCCISFRVAHYEGGAVCSHARSLWRLEPLRIAWVPLFDNMCITIIHFSMTLLYANTYSFVPVGSWSGGHIKWGQSFRIRHITTGRYLCLDEEKGLLLVDAEKANSKMSAFCFRISKVFVMQSQPWIVFETLLCSI